MRIFIKYIILGVIDLFPSILRMEILITLYPLFNNKRGKSSIKVRKDGVLYLLISKYSKQNLYFYEPSRIERYIYKNDFLNIFESMRNKYQNLDSGIFVEKGDVVLEVGANIGEFSRSVISDVKMLIVFEPDDLPFKCLSKNLEEFEGVNLYNCLCSNVDGDLPFFVSSAGADSSTIIPDKYTNSVVKKSVTIKSIIKELSLTHIDFIKLEAEGAEPEVLEGASEVTMLINKIAIDVSPERNGQTPSIQVKRILDNWGFIYTQVGDMIYARNPNFIFK